MHSNPGFLVCQAGQLGAEWQWLCGEEKGTVGARPHEGVEVGMDSITLASLAIAGMFIMILLHVPIGLSMSMAGVISYGLLTSFGASFSLLASEGIANLSDLGLVVVPLFLLMGNFASAAGISTDMYNLAHALLGRYRGGLAMATIGGCGLFGAVCGSSFATTATFGRVALPEMVRRGYAPTLATGCIAAGGNLGTLVPPSVVLVIYGIIAEQYIIRLFIAAIIPAVMTILLYFAAIMIYVRFSPEAGPAGERVNLSALLGVVAASWRAMLLIAAIAAGMYGGVFTATEAAAFGAILAFFFALLGGKMNLKVFWDTLSDTAATTAMIYVIIIGANVFNYFIVVTHMPDYLTQSITESGLSTYIVIIILLFIYLILGCIFDSIAAMLITLPFVLPWILSMGFSPFGGVSSILWWLK